MRALELDARELGRVGEEIAARHLARSGMRVLARRLETGAGEVDLCCRDGRELVCVEVKTGRSGPRFTPLQRVDRRRLERLRACARRLARAAGRPVRVDLVEVRLDAAGRLRDVLHRRDARHPP